MRYPNALRTSPPPNKAFQLPGYRVAVDARPLSRVRHESPGKWYTGLDLWRAQREATGSTITQR